MIYDRNDDQYDRIAQAGFSCAFKTFGQSFHPNYNDWFEDDTLEDRMWRALCTILTASEERSVIFATTQHEKKWIDLLTSCPYVEQIDEVKSRMGRYNVQLWIARTHERNSA